MKSLVERLEKVQAKAEKKFFNVLKSVVEDNSRSLKKEVQHYLTYTLTDTTYDKSLSNVVVGDIDFDYGALEDMIAEFDISSSSTIILFADITYNGNHKAQFTTFISIEDKMTISKADIQFTSEDTVDDCLDTVTVEVQEVLNFLTNLTNKA